MKDAVPCFEHGAASLDMVRRMASVKTDVLCLVLQGFRLVGISRKLRWSDGRPSDPQLIGVLAQWVRPSTAPRCRWADERQFDQPGQRFERRSLFGFIAVPVIDLPHAANAVTKATLANVRANASAAHQRSGSPAKIMQRPATGAAGHVESFLASTEVTHLVHAVATEHQIAIRHRRNDRPCCLAERDNVVLLVVLLAFTREAGTVQIRPSGDISERRIPLASLRLVAVSNTKRTNAPNGWSASAASQMRCNSSSVSTLSRARSLMETRLRVGVSTDTYASSRPECQRRSVFSALSTRSARTGPRVSATSSSTEMNRERLISAMEALQASW